MATSKTLTPTNVTIQIPEFTDQPDQRVNSNCIDKLGDAVNTLNSKFGIKTETVTTSAAGNAATSLSPQSTILFGASDVNNNNIICIPFRASSSVWGINVKGTTGSAVASTEMTVKLIYANLS